MNGLYIKPCIKYRIYIIYECYEFILIYIHINYI